MEVTILYDIMYCVLNCRIKEFVGFSADELIASNENIGVDLLHPAYSNLIAPMKNYCESLSLNHHEILHFWYLLFKVS